MKQNGSSASLGPVLVTPAFAFNSHKPHSGNRLEAFAKHSIVIIGGIVRSSVYQAENGAMDPARWLRILAGISTGNRWEAGHFFPELSFSYATSAASQTSVTNLILRRSLCSIS